MFIIFGWLKEEKPLGEIGEIFCYDCRRATDWIAVSESEWVSLSAIKVFRFVYKQRLHCSGCSACLALTPAEFRQLDRHMKAYDSIAGTRLHAALTQRVETEQLASKTPPQLKFIRESMQAQRDYLAALKEQSEKQPP
jgi:ferredoxin